MQILPERIHTDCAELDSAWEFCARRVLQGTGVLIPDTEQGQN